MKKNNKGFTLVELLLVVAIIGILVGMVTAGMNVVRKRARIAKATGDIAELTRAWKQYRVVYQKWPASFGQGGSFSNMVMSVENLEILQGVNSAENPKRLSFLDVASTVELTDPWGTPYRVDFSETVTMGRDYHETTVFFPNRKRYEYGY